MCSLGVRDGPGNSGAEKRSQTRRLKRLSSDVSILLGPVTDDEQAADFIYILGVMGVKTDENGRQMSLFSEQKPADETGSAAKSRRSETPSRSEKEVPENREGPVGTVCRVLREREADPVLISASAGSGEEVPPVVPSALLSVFARLDRDAEERVLLLDGANRFDPYVISKVAYYLGRPPRSFLDRVEVSRGFTCHQMWNLICEEAPDRLRDASRRPGAVFVLDLLHTFYDDDVSRQEALYLLRCCREKIDELSDRSRFVFIEHPPPQEAGERADFRKRLGTICPVRLRLSPDETGNTDGDES